MIRLGKSERQLLFYYVQPHQLSTAIFLERFVVIRALVSRPGAAAAAAPAALDLVSRPSTVLRLTRTIPRHGNYRTRRRRPRKTASGGWRHCAEPPEACKPAGWEATGAGRRVLSETTAARKNHGPISLLLFTFARRPSFSSVRNISFRSASSGVESRSKRHQKKKINISNNRDASVCSDRPFLSTDRDSERRTRPRTATDHSVAGTRLRSGRRVAAVTENDSVLSRP